ncbi:Fic family protein [Pontiella sulfatireligans]|uniref:Adenosine monophosphate-protein transferase SoFic n=1 Tax=Pontiella sulfatireligans TaxID=2750658 RepID=A0A6C2ULB2_9BACT|nr:Fic family protein [Pontiella sulfatireligans]VGO20207.1 Adenosine monophosphate-protein transferase SoFic [Pontiella sulfatireligans]
MKWKPTELVLSTDSIKKLAEVEQLIGKVEGVQLSRPVPKLRQKNRAKLIRGSTGIEGNSCSVAQVEAIASGQPVALSKKEQLEIRNALEAYDALPSLDPFSVDSLLDAHRMLMGNGLLLVPGRFRQGPVEVYVTETKTRSMPAWETVGPSMEELFGYLKDGKDLMLIKSICFHFEFVSIHPFADGNGRVARLWQTRFLMEEHPVFEFLDVESMVFEQRAAYYRQICNAQDCGNVDCFVLFMLEQIRQSLCSLWENSAPSQNTHADRIPIAHQAFGKEVFSRKDYCRLFKTISPATASRDLSAGVASGALKRAGDKRTAVYRFVEHVSSKA